jgi:PAS domain S-box-containing protein/putative nucleotidyltransferase with HDIG domain
MIVVDEGCNITLANTHAENLFGYSANQLLGQPVELLVPRHFREVHAHLHQAYLAQPHPIAIGLRRNLHGLHKDGHVIPLEIGLAPYQSSAGLRVLALINDITERKRAEAKIQTQLERLSALRTIDLVITSSFDLRVTLEIILQQVIVHLGVDAAAIWLFNETSRQLEFSAGHGFRGNGITHLRLRLGEDYAGRVALERRLLYVPDLSRVEHRLTQAEPIDGEEFVSFYAVPLIAKEKVKGVLEVFHRSLLDPDLEWLDFFQTLAGQTAIAVDNAELFNNLQRSSSELILSYDATIEGWSRALDLRDKETEGHTLRVTELTLTLAREFGFTEDQLLHIRRGALLHDIGKMGVPDHILLKPELLTEEEQTMMQKHPQYAYDLLKPIAFLHPALDIPYCHHEKWDGTGYPRRLKGEEIPIAARLFAIADIWDALTSDRPYRPAWSKREALTFIREQSGYHFDPLVVDLFFRVIK